MLEWHGPGEGRVETGSVSFTGLFDEGMMEMVSCAYRGTCFHKEDVVESTTSRPLQTAGT